MDLKRKILRTKSGGDKKRESGKNLERETSGGGKKDLSIT